MFLISSRGAVLGLKDAVTEMLKRLQYKIRSNANRTLVFQHENTVSI
jgi:hypothetical protein